MKKIGKHLRSRHKCNWIKVRRVEKHATRKGEEYTERWIVKCSICGDMSQRTYDV